jgi:hypothetical protein
MTDSLKESTLALKMLTSEEFDEKVRPEREYPSMCRTMLISTVMLAPDEP